ncbi:MFS transporter [Myxococcota bacterium]|nr:MFS transporter [Myxococcota bacterium]
MATLDFGIIGIALPRLADEFKEPPDVIAWVALTHSLVVTGLTLTAGRAGDLFGRKRVYLSGYALFTLGLCASPFSSSIGELIATRLVQATGIAMAIANSNAIVLDAFPDRERGRVLGLVTSIVGAGLMSGPAVGGLILGSMDWPAIFYLRIPIGIVVLVLGWSQLRNSGGQGHGARLDVPGALSMFFALTSLIIVVNRGTAWGWESIQTLGVAGTGITLLLVFLWVESRSSSPVLSLELLRTRRFSIPISSQTLVFMAQAGVVFSMPFYLIDVRQFSPGRSGLIVSTVSLMLLLLAPLSGLLADRFKSPLQPTVGIVLVALSLYSMGWLDGATPEPYILIRLAVIGLGLSIFGPANSSLIFASVPREIHGTASASIATARNIGTAFGIGIYSVALTNSQSLMAGVTSAFAVAAWVAFGALSISVYRVATELSRRH